MTSQEIEQVFAALEEKEHILSQIRGVLQNGKPIEMIKEIVKILEPKTVSVVYGEGALS